jgi:hypothetical protein
MNSYRCESFVKTKHRNLPQKTALKWEIKIKHVIIAKSNETVL